MLQEIRGIDILLLLFGAKCWGILAGQRFNTENASQLEIFKTNVVPML